jgi:hypothetical protein
MAFVVGIPVIGVGDPVVARIGTVRESLHDPLPKLLGVEARRRQP